MQASSHLPRALPSACRSTFLSSAGCSETPHLACTSHFPCSPLCGWVAGPPYLCAFVLCPSCALKVGSPCSSRLALLRLPLPSLSAPEMQDHTQSPFSHLLKVYLQHKYGADDFSLSFPPSLPHFLPSFFFQSLPFSSQDIKNKQCHHHQLSLSFHKY